MSLPTTSYKADQDADDEYEQRLVASSFFHVDPVSPSSDSEPHSAEPTPTNNTEERRSPKTIITQWTAQDSADFVASLGISQYSRTIIGECLRLHFVHLLGSLADSFRCWLVDNDVVGEALIALKHDELKEMGITSVGHRLTILKSVYETKIKQDIPIDADHYVPLCTFPCS